MKQLQFTKYFIQKIETILIAPANSNYERVVQITIDLPELLPFNCCQPFTHIKIKRPDSMFRARTYSISSNPDIKGYFQITIKVYKYGKMSQYLGSFYCNTFIL